MKALFSGIILLPFLITIGYAQSEPEPLFFKRLPRQTQGLGKYVGFDNMFQDQAGLIWFISNSGLYRYDGAGLMPLQSDPINLNSLSANQIKDVVQDEQGTFWITTRKGGLNAFDPYTHTFTHYRHDPTDSTTISTDDLLFLEKDQTGKLWIGSTAGLNIFDPATEKATRIQAQPGTNGALQGAPVSPIRLKDGVVYVLTTDGFEYYHQSAKRWQYFPLLDPEGDTLRIGINNTYATFKNLCLDHRGKLWMSMPGHDGLWTFDPENQQLNRFDDPATGRPPVKAPHDIIEDRSGRLWIAAEDYIWRISADRQQRKKYVALDIEEGDNLGRIHTLFEDKSGLIWMPSNSAGRIYTFNPAQEQGQVIAIPKYNNQPVTINRIIFGKKGIIWLATSWGLLRFDPVSGDVDHVMKMESCHYATAWNERYFIVCSSKGLFVFDRTTGQNWPVQLGEEAGRTFPTATYAAVDHDGDLWVSTWGDGLYLLPKKNFDIRTGVVTDYQQWTYQPSASNSLPSNLLAGIAIDSNNTAWVAGAENGLNAVNKSTGNIQRFLYQQGRDYGIFDNYTWGLLLDQQGHIWISRGGKTLERFSPETGHFQTFGTADGLPNYNIANMAMDSMGIIWLNQNQAVSSIDPVSETIRILPQIAVPKPYNEAIAVHPETGEIYFAGHLGVRSFAPDSLAILNRKPSPLLLSGVSYYPSRRKWRYGIPAKTEMERQKAVPFS
jgi:ligand-binding sensor domain-containing protein